MAGRERLPLEHFTASAYYSSTTKDLLEISIQQMRVGRVEVVEREWNRLNEEFHSSYENRGKYREFVEEATARMKQP